MMSSSAGIETILFSFGGSSLLGFAAGYALRRIIKIAAVIIGVFVLGLAYLSYKGWINVQWPVVEKSNSADCLQHIRSGLAHD